MEVFDFFFRYFIVDEGLAAGDRVIVEGLQRVRPGMAVRPIPVTTVTQ